MNLRIETTALQVAAQLGYTAREIKSAADKALQRVGEVVEQSAARFIARIYAVPENGWERTGDLQDGLALKRPSTTVAAIVIEGRASKYARPRHDLDRPGKDGLTRYNPFFTEAEEDTKSQINSTFEQEFENNLPVR